MQLPQFDKAYIISDIHLGGRRSGTENFQIFNQGARLGAFAQRIGDEDEDQNVALILNGDIFDSLAEEEVPGYVALDAETAGRLMSHLYTDPNFEPVWKGLQQMLKKPERHLVFVIGNHDIELALPVVERSIRTHLAGGDRDIEARIHFANHGGGYACKVGAARVFCTHGNELDPWNTVDYGKLGELANAINAGRRIRNDDWTPNGGTRLVVDVMNELKRRYPFVDLLKPEAATVLTLLSVLGKDVFADVDFLNAFPIAKDYKRGKKVTSNILTAGAAAEASGVAEKEIALELFGPNLRKAIEERSQGGTEDDLLMAAAELTAESERSGQPLSAVAPGEEVETLGFQGVKDFVLGWVGLLDKPEAMRLALQDFLDDDQTFDIVDPEDKLFKAMQSRVAEGVDFVVTGHTHKARAMKIPGGGYYYNSGTWIRSLRITNAVLEDKDAFRTRLWPALEAGTMAALDNARIPSDDGKQTDLVYDRTTAVRIASDGHRVHGDLLRVTGDGAGVKLKAESGAGKFTVG
jgi:UDP-2,3-diacylglucosamine pyrophosphatase LpxH